MARGRLLKTQVKEARQIAEAISVGGQKSESKKNFELSLKEHIGKMIDRVDPIELGAILSLTYVIHSTYDWAKTGLVSAIAPPLSLPWYALEIVGKLGVDEKQIKGIPDPIIWLISYIAAFYVLRHGKDMLSAVSGIIGMLGLV
jgi:hypothetical protein